MAENEDQGNDEQNRDMTDDQRHETASAEFVPLLETVQSAKDSAGAIDAAALVVVSGRVALEGETRVKRVYAIGGQRAEKIVEGNILPGKLDEFLGERTADDVAVGAASIINLHDGSECGFARGVDETAEEK